MIIIRFIRDVFQICCLMVATLWFSAVVSWMIHSDAQRRSPHKSSLWHRFKGWICTLGYVAMQRTNDPDWINMTEFQFRGRIFRPPFTFRRVENEPRDPPDWGI